MKILPDKEKSAHLSPQDRTGQDQGNVEKADNVENVANVEKADLGLTGRLLLCIVSHISKPGLIRASDWRDIKERKTMKLHVIRLNWVK